VVCGGCVCYCEVIWVGVVGLWGCGLMVWGGFGRGGRLWVGFGGVGGMVGWGGWRGACCPLGWVGWAVVGVGGGRGGGW